MVWRLETGWDLGFATRVCHLQTPLPETAECEFLDLGFCDCKIHILSLLTDDSTWYQVLLNTGLSLGGKNSPGGPLMYSK